MRFDGKVGIVANGSDRVPAAAALAPARSRPAPEHGTEHALLPVLERIAAALEAIAAGERAG